MRLSTKSSYSLQALTYMAHRAKTGGRVSLREIANAADLSEGYLEQLFSRLSATGLVAGKKGKSGGYGFVKPISDISAWEVVSAAEDSLAPAPCVLSDSCDMQDKCFTQRLWAGAYALIEKALLSVSLADLLADYEKRMEAAL